jgi:copper chaperone
MFTLKEDEHWVVVYSLMNLQAKIDLYIIKGDHNRMKETLTITGMSCGGCVASVKNALARIGVEHADVEVGRAAVEYDEAKVSHENLVEAIEDAGFDVVATA